MRTVVSRCVSTYQCGADVVVVVDDDRPGRVLLDDVVRGRADGVDRSVGHFGDLSWHCSG